MLRADTILCPTDFSQCGDAALPAATSWARALGAELHLFQALELHGGGNEEEVMAGLEQRAQALQGLPTPAKCALSRSVGAAPAILNYADEHQVDLVIMNTHGRRGLRRFLLGSVTEEVVQRSHCPVLTVRDEGRGRSASVLRRILVPLDLSTHSAMALRHAKHLAARSNAEVQLLHVLVKPSFPAHYEALGAPDLYTDTAQLRKESEAALEKLYRTADGPEGLFSVHVVGGLAIDEILRFASENQSQLLVLGSHGLTGISHLFLGSVAEKVIRQAACPVLTVKVFGKALLADEGRSPNGLGSDCIGGARG